MNLPSLTYDFSHADITDVTVGPRREFTLTVNVLVFEGFKGRHIEGVRVRFGGVANFEEVSAFWKAGPHRRSELAWLRYAEGRRSKPGALFFELVFERTEARLVVQCSSLQITRPATDVPSPEPTRGG
jgi:hypothetical protein